MIYMEQHSIIILRAIIFVPFLHSLGFKRNGSIFFMRTSKGFSGSDNINPTPSLTNPGKNK